MPYRRLNPDLIIATAETLSRNMKDRFADRGLTLVAQELVEFARQEAGNAQRVARPRLFLRSLVYLTILSALLVLGYLAWQVKSELMSGFGLQNFENFEALLNILILLAAGLWALLTLEMRVKRHEVLVRLNALRSIAHVIDMHQLSKDPMGGMHRGEFSETPPESDLQGYDLARYLDYCADLLAITGKLAAVYLEYIEDPVVLNTINDFESLTSEMARKIWQKVTVLELQGDLETQSEGAKPLSDTPHTPASADLPPILK